MLAFCTNSGRAYQPAIMSAVCVPVTERTKEEKEKQIKRWQLRKLQ